MDALDNLYVGGSFQGGSLTFGSSTVTKATNFGAFVAKYNKDFVKQWVSAPSMESPNTRGGEIAFESVNNVLVAVGTSDSASINLANGTTVTGTVVDMQLGWIVSMDPASGNIMNAAFGNEHRNVLAHAGSILAAGQIRTEGTPGIMFRAGIFEKVDPASLIVVKQKLVLGEGSSKADLRGLAIDSSGQIFVVGGSSAATIVGVNDDSNITASAGVGSSDAFRRGQDGCHVPRMEQNRMYPGLIGIARQWTRAEHSMLSDTASASFIRSTG